MSTGPIAQQGANRIVINVVGGPLSFDVNGVLGYGTLPLQVTSNYIGTFNVSVSYNKGSGWITAKEADTPWTSGDFDGPNFPIYVDCAAWPTPIDPMDTRTAYLTIYPVDSPSDTAIVNITQTGLTAGGGKV